MNTASYASPLWWLWSVPLEWERWQTFARETLQKANLHFFRTFSWSLTTQKQNQEAQALVSQRIYVETVALVTNATAAVAKKVSTLPARSVTMPQISLAGIHGSLLDLPPQEHALNVCAPRAPPRASDQSTIRSQLSLPKQVILLKDCSTKSTSALVRYGNKQ